MHACCHLCGLVRLLLLLLTVSRVAGSLHSFLQRSQPREAALAPRRVRRTPSAAESFRQSCSFDPKPLSERLRDYLETCEPDMPSVALCGEGVTIMNGTIELPAGHMLIVEGDDMALSHLSIVAAGGKGDGCEEGNNDEAAGTSLPLLFASHTALTLRHVKLSSNPCGHGLGVGSNGVVSAVDCTFSRNWTCGALVRGASAQLTAQGCAFERNAQDGCSIGDGATAELVGCTLDRNAMLGVGASGIGTTVVATRCNVAGSDNHGFSACNGADVTLQKCEVVNNNIGVLALGTATCVAVQECTLQDNRQGTHAREGATMAMTDCSLLKNSIGACVCDVSTSVTITRGAVAHSAATGVQVFAGSQCTAKQVSIAHNGGHGIAVKHKHSLLKASRLLVEENGMAGVHVSVMATAKLATCKLLSNRVSGLQATVRSARSTLQC